MVVVVVTFVVVDTFVIRLSSIDGGIRAKDNDDGWVVAVVGYCDDGGSWLSR